MSNFTQNKTKYFKVNFVETERTELKQRFTDAIPKEIVAFLNIDGGTVYIGGFWHTVGNQTLR